jgi:tetratricopeptide (TPR) repeat protein
LAEASYNRGVIYQLKGELEKAANDYRQAIAVISYHVMARKALSDILRKLGKSNEADEQETMARNLIRSNNEYNQACFEAICGNADKAIEFLKFGLTKKQTTKSWARLSRFPKNMSYFWREDILQPKVFRKNASFA